MTNFRGEAMSFVQSNRVVELKIPSELGFEKVAREAVSTVARRMGFAEDRIQDIKTAIDEACTNAIRHGGWSDARMKVVVVLTADETKLDILIKDPGVSGKPPEEISIPDIEGMIAGKKRLGGMGLFIIKELVDEAEFLPDEEDGGNKFHMVIYRMPSENDPLPPDITVDDPDGGLNS
jgi:serine/threonine-protein kinase RsbW